MAGEEKAWRPPRLWRWDAQPATSLSDVPPWIGRLAYAAALTITGGPAFCYLAYQLGQRDGVHLQSSEEPFSQLRWRLIPRALPDLAADKRFIAVLGTAGILLAFIGSLLPWATLTDPSVGEVTVSGTEVAGILTLAVAVAAAGFLVWFYLGTGHGVGHTTLLFASGLAVSAIAIYDLVDTNNMAGELRLSALVEVLPGLYVTLAGGFVIGAAGILGIWSRQQLASEPDDPAEFLLLLSPFALVAAILYAMPMLGFAGVPMPLLLLPLAGPLAACLVVAHVANLSYKQGLRVGARTGVAPESLITPTVWTWALTGVFFLATLLLYYVTYTGQAVHNHPVRLADAFLQGRLDVANGKDLIGFLDFAIADDGKYYPLEPPGTSLVILIGVAIFGLAINQTLVSIVIGALSASVVWRLARGVMKTLSQQVGLTIFFVFGTFYWWNATYAGVWYFNHTVAVLFLFGAVYETLVSKRPLTAGLLLGAAYITRAPSSLTFPFFLIMFSDQWLRWSKDLPLWKRVDLKPLVLFGVGAGIFVVGFAILNYLRFDTVSPRAAYDHWHYLRPETCGTACQPGGLFGAGFFDRSYIPRHIPLIFEKPFYMTEERPYILPSWGGNAFWMTTPAFLFAFLAGITRRWLRVAGAVAMVFSILMFGVLPNLGRGPTTVPWFDWAQWSTKGVTSEMIFNIPVSSWLLMLPFIVLIAFGTYSAIRSGNKLVVACWLAIVPTALVHFSHGNTGYPQFGYRYILDYAPFIFLLTWQGMGQELKWNHVALIAVSIIITFGGILWVNKFDANVTGGFHWVSW